MEVYSSIYSTLLNYKPAVFHADNFTLVGLKCRHEEHIKSSSQRCHQFRWLKPSPQFHTKLLRQPITVQMLAVNLHHEYADHLHSKEWQVINSIHRK